MTITNLMLTRPEVESMTGLSRATIYGMMRKYEFSEPFRECRRASVVFPDWRYMDSSHVYTILRAFRFPRKRWKTRNTRSSRTGNMYFQLRKYRRLESRIN